MLTIALSHLLGSGVRLEAHEAVALARDLLAQPCGIPMVENVQISSDGLASCIGREGVPSVARVAELLWTLLPPGTPSVPAPLRYAIARGLQTVEAPPFASPGDFSSALARFEKGASRDVLRGVLQRGARASRPVEAPAAVAPSPPAASAAPLFASVGAERAGSPEHASRRWLLAGAAALVASFAVGFVVTDRMTDRETVATPIAAKPRGEIVGVPSEPATAQERLLTAAPQTNAPARPFERAIEPVRAIQAIRASNANAFSPAFASDGTAIFFHTGTERDARSAIDVAAARTQAGGDLGIMTIVDDGSHNYHAQPSPDGRFVAFDSDRGGERGIYVANRDGSHVRRLSGPGYAAVPTWSRTSEWLTYIRAEAHDPSVWNLWAQPAAGGSARRLTNYRYGQTWAASWFPDDRRIAYSHEDALMVMDLQTGETTRYRTPVNGRLVRTPAVSPDGTTIIFQVFRDGAWLLDLSDGSMRRVLTDPTAEEFAWAPDGQRVAFHSRRDGQWGIYVLSRN